MGKMTIEQAFDLGLQNHKAGRLAEAEQIYRQILAHEPNHADALNFLGMISNQLGRREMGVELIRKAIALEPDRPGYHSNLGNVLGDLGQLDQAVAAYRKAIELDAGCAGDYYNLGNALLRQGQLDQAIAACRTAIQLDPHFAEAHNTLATALGDAGRPDEAITAYRRAIELNPGLAEAYNNLANALKDVGEWDQAIASYRTAMKLKPENAQAYSNLILGLHYHPGVDATAIAEEEGRWNHQHAEPLKHLRQPHGNKLVADRRLRVGYVSPDFCRHPIGRFMLPLLENHDRAAVEIFCYANVLRSDEMTERLRGNTDHWRMIRGVADQQVAQTVREDRIDILVDLAMHASANRLLVFARKPAPVQVTWLGYPGSTGMSSIDYRLSDAQLDPPGMDESIYSEQTIRLPGCFWCYDPVGGQDVPINALPALANGTVTFGCLSKFAKVNRPLLSLWASVLRQVKDSRLVLLANPGSHIQRTADEFSRQGIDPRRLEFIAWRSHREYLAQFHRIDLALDSLPYNGHTTTFDGLWMGVPTVSLTGKTAVGRAGLSILSGLGLPELVGDCDEAYVRIAVELAQDLPRLRDLRSTLRQRMERSPLMDGRLFAQNIEAAYREMWRRWCEAPGQ
jgi:predicted O-linked N-acetylglucosamine transferase (SPINDLY family)